MEEVVVVARSAVFRAGVMEEVLSGSSIEVVAGRLGVSGGSLRGWLREAGVVMRVGRPRSDRPGSVVLRPPAASAGAGTGHGRRLGQVDRVRIEVGIGRGLSVGRIAAEIGVHRSSVYRELARHRVSARDGRSGRQTTHYSSVVAQHRADRSRARPKPVKLAQRNVLRRVVVEMLNSGWSPRQVSVRLPRVFPHDESMRISHETIYQALYVQGAGALRQELKRAQALRSGRTSRLPASKLPARSSRPWLDGHRLADRDELLAAGHAGRKVPGHWEGDLVVGPNNSGIITLVERASRFTLLGRLPGTRDSTTVIDKLTSMIQDLPDAVRRSSISLTWDQGAEMAQHPRFTIATGCPVFFCDPHSPWQRPSNENLNGQLRWEYPKGTDFNTVTDEELQTVQDMLNARPRVILNGATPHETLNELLATVALTD